MASNNNNSKDIKYLSKDFSSLRNTLIEYAKGYYPNAYNDFSTASPGSMFIDMAAYVGDVMSFYLDNQIQENFLQYAKQKENLMTMAYMLGYRPKVTSAAAVTLDFYQTIPALNPIGGTIPDFRYALLIQEGAQISSVGSGIKYYIPEQLDFSISSSANPTDITVYETDVAGTLPTKFLLKKSIQAISGEVKTVTISAPTTRTKYFTTTISDANIIEIIDVYDSDGNKYYEVPYLAQNVILTSKKNTQGTDPNYQNSSIEVPYLLEVQDATRRFVTRFKSDNTLELQFGAGTNHDTSFIDQNVDEDFLPDVYRIGMGTIEGRSLVFNAYNPANFVNTKTYGLSPYNTTLTIKYLAGGGAKANVGSNQISILDNYTSSFYGGVLSDPVLESSTLLSLAVNNPSASSGGGDGDTVEEIRLNTLVQFPTQMRAVTEQDYLATIYTMPAKFGQIAKAYITKDITLTSEIAQVRPEVGDPQTLSAYLLSYDLNKNLVEPPSALLYNLKTYLSNYRMITDSITLKSGYIINIGLDFEITLRPNQIGREVLANCISVLKDMLNISKIQINQPIILSEIFTALDRVVGVQTVKKVHFYNLTDADGEYSPYGYDIAGATVNGILYPSLDPSCFEIKFPDTDIYGRVVTFN